MPASDTSSIASASAPLLLARGWAGERGGVLLWGPLDLTVRPGEVWHVEGANGSGKTTLLRTLAGLRAPALDGGSQLAADLWWVGHADALADELDAALNLRLLLDVGGAHHVPTPAAVAHLAAQGVPLGRAVWALSAGQRRKLALAPLFLAPRRLWLLDEPFDALDASARDAVALLAQQHVARGGAIVLTSHQPLPAQMPAARTLRLAARGAHAAALVA